SKISAGPHRAGTWVRNLYRPCCGSSAGPWPRGTKRPDDGPSTSGQPGTPLPTCRQPIRPRAETTLDGWGRHQRCDCPPARLSSAHAQPAQLLMHLGVQATGMEWPCRYRTQSPEPRRGPAVVVATRPGPTPPGRVKDPPRFWGTAAARLACRKHLATAAIPRESAASPVTDQAARRALPAAGRVAADGPDQPTLGVADLQQRIGEAVSAAFPDRVWLCGEVVGTPAVRGGGAGIAFTLAESRGSTVLTLRAWLGRPYYPQLRQQLGDAEVTELLTAGNLVVVGGWLQYGGPFSSLELKVDRVGRTPGGARA